jgi:DNA-binding PadR family transcriptional regulator
MAELQNEPISGYDVISFIHNKFGFLASSGTVYSLLYSLERNGLVEGIWIERKRVYKLTEKGAKPSKPSSTRMIKSRVSWQQSSKPKHPNNQFLFTTKPIEMLKNPLVFFYQPQRIKRGSVAQSG